MSSEFPDILGDLVEARQRFEISGVHYMVALEPAEIAPGETTALHLWLQNCWDIPVKAVVTAGLPAQASPTFSILQERTDVPLKAAEVGQLTIPIASSAETEPGTYLLPLMLTVKSETRGLYIRSQKTAGQLGQTLLSFTTGLELASTTSLGFAARTMPKQELSLRVSGPPQSTPPADLTPTFVSNWTIDDLAFVGKARQHVNDQRLYLQPQLTRQALYLSFLDESQTRFKDCGLPLHIGEAIYLAKILTFAVEYFLEQPHRQDVILIPPYMLAYRYSLPMDDPVFLIVRADYARIARLAISISFGLMHQRLKRDVWTAEEQLALADLIADRVERGGALPAEFLYLPLLLGGLLVTHQVQMPGEKPLQSLKLLETASQQRAVHMAENPDLVSILNQLLERARRGS
jgi:hypothetical protein